MNSMLEVAMLGAKMASSIVGNVPQQHKVSVLTNKDTALIDLRQKDGAVIVCLGARDTGKSELSYRIANFIQKPVYALSPEQKPHPKWITQITMSEIMTVPPRSTIIMDDLPVYMSNRDYREAMVDTIERMIPMVRHDKKLHFIFASQTAAQADKYILDCDAAFFKPLGLLTADIERQNVRRIYKINGIDEMFDQQTEMWVKKHAFMLTRLYKGLITINKVS